MVTKVVEMKKRPIQVNKIHLLKKVGINTFFILLKKYRNLNGRLNFKNMANSTGFVKIWLDVKFSLCTFNELPIPKDDRAVCFVL